jgi:hypothetical protein
MSEGGLFPDYISRSEEQDVLHEVAQVRDSGKSRAILLYGVGGVGKTWLVRGLTQAHAADKSTTWLKPIDVDDSEYWLLSNLEREVARRLDPQGKHFGQYLEYITQLPSYTRPRVGHETVVSHLGRIKRVFVECYEQFVRDSGKTVVMVFDTVEAIRGMYLLLTLTQWMKALPATLFILSGRPVTGGSDEEDPIKRELQDPYQGMDVTTVDLGGFSRKEALAYLSSSQAGSVLSETERQKLVQLTRGHPLWLAFTISYLNIKDMPEEARISLARIKRDVTYQGVLTQAGESLQEAFKRRLVTPYRDSDFWHEAIKRLAVLRQGINETVWRRVMDGQQLPPDTAMADTWNMLLDIPWIRPRANRRYVTLHDAVAEELAQRIIPVHDQGSQWRKELWQRAVDIYHELTQGPEPKIAEKQALLDERLVRLGESLYAEHRQSTHSLEEATLIAEVALLDTQKRELDQFKAVYLFYQLLSDFEEGCRQFLELFAQATDQNDALFLDLLALEMQRFLPRGAHQYAFGDVIAEVIDDFRRWLSTERPDLYLKIGLILAEYLVKNEQPQAAIQLADVLPTANADTIQRYRINILRGNALMRIPGQVKDGLPHFQEALAEAVTLTTDDKHKLLAEAYKELGFYYRNEGMWTEADASYEEARDALLKNRLVRSSAEDREELASIQTNWAYVKGLSGNYRDGTNLVESAITIRHNLQKHQEEGISWSVCGEVYRYERRFRRAWVAYAFAEQVFHGQRNWGWLGLLYQQQAICLFQAKEDGINLTSDRDPIERAKRLITLSLDICSDQAIRGYPSALNRAGRIFGQSNADDGLAYLERGIDWARRLSDGWFWFANLLEYAELSYRAWRRTGHRRYRDAIAFRGADVDEVMSQYQFPDLRGRWSLLQGALRVHDWKATGDAELLSMALRNYRDGFVLVAREYVGSSGRSAIPTAFRSFGDVLRLLPSDVRAKWLDELRRAWLALAPGQGSTMLLARLEELY